MTPQLRERLIEELGSSVLLTDRTKTGIRTVSAGDVIQRSLERSILRVVFMMLEIGLLIFLVSVRFLLLKYSLANLLGTNTNTISLLSRSTILK